MRGRRIMTSCNGRANKKPAQYALSLATFNSFYFDTHSPWIPRTFSLSLPSREYWEGFPLSLSHTLFQLNSQNDKSHFLLVSSSLAIQSVSPHQHHNPHTRPRLCGKPKRCVIERLWLRLLQNSQRCSSFFHFCFLLGQERKFLDVQGDEDSNSKVRIKRNQERLSRG